MTQNHNLYFAVLAVGLLFMGLTFGANAFAADQNPCSEDIAKFCKADQKGTILECLERHESELSDTCKVYEATMERSRVESREASRQQMRIRQACREDVLKFCNDVKLGASGITKCLKAHADELSIPCREAVGVAKGGKEEKTSK